MSTTHGALRAANVTDPFANKKMEPLEGKGEIVFSTLRVGAAGQLRGMKRNALGWRRRRGDQPLDRLICSLAAGWACPARSVEEVIMRSEH